MEQSSTNYQEIDIKANSYDFPLNDNLKEKVKINLNF